MTPLQDSSRRSALDALRRWRTTTEFADAILQNVFARSQLSASDRAFAQELFYGVLRNLTLLDFWIGFLRRGRIEAALRDILRLGLYQLFLLGSSEHAAVYETVELASKQQRPVVNAVLRAALRQKDKLLEQTSAEPLAVRLSHPAFLIDRWQNAFGPDATARLCHWNNQPPVLYARVNRLRTSVSDFLATHPGASLLPGYDSFVSLTRIQDLGRGEFYVQDPSTACACELLRPRPGERVLDACAAPGGKSAYLAEMMNNRGVIVACDRSPKRVELLRTNLARLGVTNAVIANHDWRSGTLAADEFDRILLDAPCSNTGVMRRRVDVRWRLRPDEFTQMHELQMTIARNVIPLLKPGGILVYSTCSLEREENGGVIEQIEREFPRLKLDVMKSVLPFRDQFDGAFAARLISH